METKRPGPSLRVAVPMIVLGVLLGILPAVRVGLAFGRVLFSDTHGTAVDTRMHLDRGRYTFYELTGGTTTDPVIDPSAVDVHPADGGPRLAVVPYEGSGSETIGRNGKNYDATLQFRVSEGGAYVIHVTTSTATRYIVTRGLGDTFHDVLGWILLGVLAALLFVAGVLATIIGVVRRL